MIFLAAGILPPRADYNRKIQAILLSIKGGIKDIPPKDRIKQHLDHIHPANDIQLEPDLPLRLRLLRARFQNG